MLDERALQIAKELVFINSVNGTAGEKEIGLKIESLIKAVPYFQKHPDYVIIQQLDHDPLDRRNVFAFIKGEGNPWRQDTILFHGHTDTVGIEDYGALQEYACMPDILSEKLKQISLPADAQKDLLSGEYLFGRGTCDMKSGDAVFLSLLERLAKHPESLCGNVVFSFNPVEENLHLGMIQGLRILQELKDTYGLQYRLAVNNDFICPLYPGDPVKTLYTGMAGKLLPCFYIRGRETHVGQPFEGFSAAETAARLVNTISSDPSFADTCFKETACPPVVLKMKDLKEHYDVQTPSKALVYFNYFVLDAGNDVLTEQLKQAAEKTLEEQMQTAQQKESSWYALSGDACVQKEEVLTVLSFAELVQKTKEKGIQIDVDALIQKEIEKGTDAREAAVPIINEMLDGIGLTTPTIVLYYAPPYCPHNTIKDEGLLNALQTIVNDTSEETGEKFRFRHFYPSLSDSSYICCDDSAESIHVLHDCFPGMDVLYPLPLEQMASLSIPAVNFGCYGKDAHKWTERVNVPYTFGILPVLLGNTISHFL